MSNINCKNLDSCDSCDSCYSCYYCSSCYSCDYCYSCYYCSSCDSCDSCDSCYSCYYCSSCYSCIGLRMSERMLFCVGDGKYESSGRGYQKNNQIFNTQLSTEEFDKIKASLPIIKISLIKWVDKNDMTKDEKEDNASYTQTGGFLKTISYQDAWQLWWNEAKQEDKNKITSCKYFDAAIFKKITGLNVSKIESLSGRTVKVELDGKTYEAVIK